MSYIKVGNVCGEKFACEDMAVADCCTIWYPYADDEETGMCFDFPAEDLPNLIELLQALRDQPADNIEI